MRDFFASIDTILMGRKTYEKGLKFGQDGYDGFVNYIFTRGEGRQSPKENVKFISGGVRAFVGNLKMRQGKDVCLTGGGELAKTFFEANLIDELILNIQAKIIGKGIPLFLPHEMETDLELIDVRTRKSGSVQILYRVKR